MATGDLYSSFTSGLSAYDTTNVTDLHNGAVVSGSVNGAGTGLETIALIGGNGGTNTTGTVSGATAGYLGVVGAQNRGQFINGAVINSGGAGIAVNGGVISGATVSSGGGLLVAAGVSGVQGGAGSAGTIIDPYVLSGGQVAVGEFSAKGRTFTGAGTISGGTFQVGATEMVSSGYASGGTFHGTQLLLNGGTAVGGLFNSGGVQLIGGYFLSSNNGSGGTTTRLASVSGTESGWVKDIASATGATIGNGGTAYVLAGGTSISATVGSGGTEVISSGGVASGIIVSGGTEIVVSGGVTTSATVVSGGTEILSGGTAASTKIGSGGTQLVNSGGTAISAVVSGGVEVVSSGGSALGTVVSAYGNSVVSAGGYVSGTVVRSDGGLAISGVASNTIVSAGGVAEIGSGGKATTISVLSGSVFVASGGVASNTTISGGTQTVNAGGTAVQSIINQGGVLSAYNGATLSGTVTVSGGATLALGGNNGNAKIDLAGTSALNPATVVIAAGVTDVPEEFTSWSDGDKIVFNSVTGAASDVTFSDADHITFYVNQQKYTLHIDNIENSYKFVTGSSLTLETCFLTNTLIRMLNGPVAVQDVRPGDTVMVRNGDAFVPSKVKWVGKNKAVVRADAAYADEAGYPVLIVKDALADGVPFKDLRVTPEHCLFIDGQFIPARMLVNGRSIRYDTNYAVYDYYHIETEDHSVIEADGVLTETYLDTGNRASFARVDGSDVVTGYFEASKNWIYDAAAPLATSREVVEPVYQLLVERSKGLALGDLVTDAATWSDDANLHLETEAGSSIRAIKQNGNTMSFMLPPGVQKVFIASRTSRPVDVIGAFVDDRRELGVQIAKIDLLSGAGTFSISSHLETETLEGWASLENNEARWTSGRALVDLSAVSVDGFKILTIEVVSTVSYCVDDQQQSIALHA